MGNIWLALIPTIFVSVVFTGIITFQFICKPDYYGLKIIACICMMIVMLLFSVPYFNDMVDGKTTVVIAEYDGFHKNSKIGTRKVFFIENNRRFELFVPGYAQVVGKLEDGKIYQIEYFNNSKLIKSYRLIE